MAGPNVTLRISGVLREYLDECTGPDGVYETPSEYLRDLIRKDMEKKDQIKWERLRAGLKEGLLAKDEEYSEINAEDIKQRGRRRKNIKP